MSSWLAGRTRYSVLVKTDRQHRLAVASRSQGIFCLFSITMKTLPQRNIQSQHSNQFLIYEAFMVLLKHLGPEKTMQLWHLFMPPQEDYVKTRRKLFAGKDVAALAEEAQKLNRE
jgi:hypothetical protein